MAFKLSKPENTVDVLKEYTAEQIYSDLPEYTKQDKVLIVDGDIICFKIASVTEFKYLYTSSCGEDYKAKSKKAFKSFLDEKVKLLKEEILKKSELGEDAGYLIEELNLWSYENFTVTSIQEAEPVSYAIKSINDSIAKVMEYCGCNKVEFYIGGSGNFRNEIPLPTQYKTNRKEALCPIHLTSLKEYLIKFKGAKRVCGQEADDVVSHRIRNLTKQGIRCTLYSNDKDSLQGVDYVLNIYNPDKEDIILSKKGIGELIDRGSDVKGSGLKWLILQTLLGDETDGFTPKVFFKKRYADKSFYKDFNNCKTEVEILEKFVEVAKRLVPDSVSYTSFTGQLMDLPRKELFEMYYKLPKMKDGWCETLEELFSFYNLDVEMLNYE